MKKRKRREGGREEGKKPTNLPTYVQASENCQWNQN